ncbi:MAG: FAD-linked oxidase C-terminal domain-containing protein [Hyphomicrobium sp.]|jgi:glycolate oxidase
MTLSRMPEPDRNVLDRSGAIIKELEALLGVDGIISEEEGRRAFEADALTAYRQAPLAVVLPRSTEDVSKVLKYCHENGLKVVPRGAGTSLCGGALPTADAIVIGTSRMNRVIEADFINRTITVECGITNLAITDAVSAEGFFYAPDPSSQLACTVGGNLAMNSGGAHCLKYGVTTNNVLGLKIVLMNGEIVEVGGPYLDSEGYDFLALIVGSEGQFGIVTEATLKIIPKAETARPVMLGFNSCEAAGQCVAAIIGSGIIPVAIEYMDRPAIAVCEAYAKAGYPLDVEALLIVEVEGYEAETTRLLRDVVDIARSFDPKVIEASTSAEHSARIWKGRKAAFGAMGRISDYYCMDGTIPLSRLPEVLNRIAQICAEHRLQVANVFHAGDGNLHPLILYDANNSDEALRAELAGAEILKLCVAVGGCLTGEHGVGIEKRDLMDVQFTPSDLAVQMRIKSVFDPYWLLNPGKVFPLSALEMVSERPAAADQAA